MKKIFDGTVGISLGQRGHEVRVRLEPGQYQVKKLPLFEPFLAEKSFLLPGSIAEMTEENLEICYPLPEGAVSVAREAPESEPLRRLGISQKFRELIDWKNRDLHIFIHPDNLYLVGERLQAAHRGLLDIVQPGEPSPQQFLQQYRALILSTLNPKYDYETLIAGAGAVREPFSKEVLSADTPEAVAELVDKQYQALRREQLYRKKMVSRTRYSLFKWGSLGLAAAVACFTVWCIVTLGYSMPQQTRVIDSQSAFLTKNYGKATDILEQDDPAALPKSAQYVLAASYVNLEGITVAEKNFIINNLSLNSSPQELQYWIFIGRGELEKALDTAKVLGNQQWILNAYYKLHDAAEISTTISGEEKQKLLQEYQKQILEHEKAIGGQADEIQK